MDYTGMVVLIYALGYALHVSYLYPKGINPHGEPLPIYGKKKTLMCLILWPIYDIILICNHAKQYLEGED